MFSSNKQTPRMRSPKRTNEQLLQDRTKPGLSLDTNFSRHLAQPPQEVHSYQTAITSNGVSNKKSPAGSKTSAPLHKLPPRQSSRVKPSRLDFKSTVPNDEKTPVIIVTPARGSFDLPRSPDEPKRRAPSSVYSRYTDYAPRSAGLSNTAPPVPPLSSLAPHAAGRRGLGSLRRNRNQDVRQAQAASFCTVFEEDTSPATANDISRSASVQRSAGTAPTPRGNGWWNLITSPFSAHSGAFSWKSPTIDEQTPILHNGQRRFSADSDDIQSAPVMTRGLDGSNCNFSEQRQSMTAPSVISIESDEIDIYRIPSQGEAAPYYDLGRHFPSLMISPSQAQSAFDNETPVTTTDGTRGVSVLPQPAQSQSTDPKVAFIMMPFSESRDPFADEHRADSDRGGDTTRGMFSSPSAEELKTPVPFPRMPDDRQTPTTHASQQSPLSPSPILGQAHIAQVIGEVNGEQKQVNVPAAKPITPPAPQGLQFATMASRSGNTPNNAWTQAHPPRSVGHSRTSSYGLGITGSEAELFPASRELSEKQHAMPSEDTVRRPWCRRLLWPMIVLIAGLITLMVVLLVMHIPQNHSDIPVQAQWVNLTGFPPLPTGVATVSQPKAVRYDSGCVNPAALWSCDAPTKEQDSSSALPNFRFELRFRNDSSLNSSMVQTQHARRATGSRIARSVLYKATLFARDAWTDSLYVAKPTPPPTADQIFLGNTTDNITAPYDGEATPFYISLLDAASLNTTGLQKRQDSVYPYPTNENSTDTNSTSSGPQSIPKIIVNDDGTPTDALLYPLAVAQPLRLYKRGAPSEHFGFYTYFDRTVYVANSSSGNVISNTPLSNTSAVCTWSQSRLLVQIWTHGFASQSLTSTSNSTMAAVNSTANDLKFPGSFPYDVTITVDRHGGDASRKGVYCYGVGANQRVEQSVKAWIDEDRAHGGTLVNPAGIPTDVGQTLASRDTSRYGGIDGGTGGCACAWQNW